MSKICLADPFKDSSKNSVIFCYLTVKIGAGLNGQK